MNLTQRRGAIAFAIVLGVALIGVTVTLNIGWIILNERRLAISIVGVIFFAALIAGLVLNTVFLVREVRRNQQQDSFLNAVTHELKTPIASIRLYLETLQRRPVSEEQRQEFYRIMLADSDRLLGTVNRVLTAGTLAQRRHDRRALDLESLLEECVGVTLQQHRLQADAVRLDPVPGGVRLVVLANAEDLRTAILNVLDNAVKYSPDGVHIRISLLMERYTMAAIRVSDTGLGLPAGQHKRIFRRFYRVQHSAPVGRPGSRAQETGASKSVDSTLARTAARIRGTGLGLFLVRTILRQHGGDATADSAGPGRGTTIMLTLPLANNAAGMKAGSSIQPKV